MENNEKNRWKDMDQKKKRQYNKFKEFIEVINMSQAALVEENPKINENGKDVDVLAIRKKLAVTTLPGNTLIDLYKEGK